LADNKTFRVPLNDEQLDGISAGTGAYADCGVQEVQFPFVEKCCSKSSSISGTVYKKACSYCSIWTSLPDGTSLEITYIVECSQYGYGKRIKE
jgi:hypothetical protein